MSKLKVKNHNDIVTNKTLQEAVDGIMGGMDRIIAEMKTGFKFITDNFASKEDLKREISWVRDDIKGLTADLSQKASKADLNKLQTKVDKYLQTN